jgi:hypothetical protein
MSNILFSKKFNVSIPNVNLSGGDKIYFKFILDTPLINNFTASLDPGQLTISSLIPSIGYASLTCNYLETSNENDEIVLSNGLTNFHDNGYIFTPNPIPPTSLNPVSSLYPIYGDVDYPFIIKPYDLILLYLNDGTYLEYTIINLIN